MPEAKHRITSLVVDRVDLVPAGDNPPALISLFKSREADPARVIDTQICGSCGRTTDASAEMCTKCEAPLPTRIERISSDVDRVAKAFGDDSWQVAAARGAYAEALGHEEEAERWADYAKREGA